MAFFVFPFAHTRLTYTAGNEMGELPIHVAASPAMKDLISNWDVGRTDSLVDKFKVCHTHLHTY